MAHWKKMALFVYQVKFVLVIQMDFVPVESITMEINVKNVKKVFMIQMEMILMLMLAVQVIQYMKKLTFHRYKHT